MFLFFVVVFVVVFLCVGGVVHCAHFSFTTFLLKKRELIAYLHRVLVSFSFQCATTFSCCAVGW